MNDQPKSGINGHNPMDLAPAPFARTSSPFMPRWWQRFCGTLPALLVVALWFVFAYVLPLHSLRESRQTVRLELTHLLQTDRPDVPAVLEAFDRATEQVLLSASAPYFILGLATLFLIAHLALVKRRLHLAELHIQCLREVMCGVDGAPLG